MPFFRHPLPPALLCALLWGSAFPTIKQVYTHWEDQGVERTLSMILLFAGIRFCLAGSGLLIGGRHLKKELQQTPYRLLVGLTLTQTFIQYIFFYQAVATSSASLVALLVATGSFWWMILAPLIQKTPWPTRKQWLGLVIGGIGVSLAIYKPGVGAGNPLIGALLMLLATASGALAIILFQKIKPTMSAVNGTGISLFFGGLGLMLAGANSFRDLPEMFSPLVIMSTIWLCIVSATAFSIWNHLSTIYPVPLLASYRFLIPICGVLEALLFVTGESAGWGLALGGPLVILSMLWARRA